VQRNSGLGRLASRLSSHRAWDEWSETNRDWTAPEIPEVVESAEPRASRRSFNARRVALSSTFVVIFFAAATFTAGAGDVIAKALDPAKCAAYVHATGEDASVCADLAAEGESLPIDPQAVEPVAVAPEAAPADTATAAPAPEVSTEVRTAVATQVDPSVVDPAAVPAADAPAAEPVTADAPAASEPENANEPLVYGGKPTRVQQKGKASSRHWVVRRAKETKAAAPVVEKEGHGAATVWLNRALPDPTPPAKRLSPRFAKNLQHIAAVNGVSWALVLGVLRAEGSRERVPATIAELNALASGLSRRGAAESEWEAVLSLSGRTSFADRAVALARYNRAVGLGALVNGLEAAKPRLVKELLADSRATIYTGGRSDLEFDKIDVRVVVLIRYLAESYGEVTVSSLFSGHRKYARPGVVSAHTYGHAVDVATVGGTSILGHQQPGSITEKAVRSILMLPVEVQPKQVISLLGMGGPSFALSDHYNHVHVGY
jgi:hypothetical protein